MTPRWKVMAGILGITIGGLAAIAGQCQSPDTDKPEPASEAPLIAEAPKPKAKPTLPPVIETPALPDSLPFPLPVPAATAPQGMPDLPKADVVPASAAVPPVLPSVPMDLSPKPMLPPMDAPAVPMARPTKPVATSGFAEPVPEPTLPRSVAPTVPEPSIAPIVPVEDPAPAAVPPAPVKAPLHTSATAPIAAVAAATKFRIILRVGEGEPMFEVRHGDDLVMKVLCEKIDIKSPEKGQQGLSAVTATGKVRFVGFGAEGTCDTFSFLAGTGEVAMSGNVKVQVRDKIGRVESELIADQMRYKLDTSAMPGLLKP